MLKLELRMDRDRIEEKGEYDPEKLQERLDKGFFRFGFRKEILADGTICYWGNNQRHDYAHFGALINSLEDTPWFMEYVDKWLWYNSDGQPDENCYNIEDILFLSAHRRSA